MVPRTQTTGDAPRPSMDVTRWAVLVGIDQYGGSDNLRGCANDAVLVYDFLCTHLNVPPDHIFLHIAENQTNEGSNYSGQYRILEATPAAVKASLEQVIEAGEKSLRNNDEAFVHVHFSGHGSTQPTIFRKGAQFTEKRKRLQWFSGLELTKEPLPGEEPPVFEVTAKSPEAKDELLLFPKHQYVTDVEFGKMLTEMGRKGLTVSATVDCCFSGGTMRGNRAIRCRSLGSSNPENNRGYQSNEETATSWAFRNCVQRDSFLYRQQQCYNAIMACQADQRAKEGPIQERHPDQCYGVFTSAFIGMLESINDCRSNITYGQFQGVLGAILNDHVGAAQIPAYFGPDDRILFDKSVDINSPELAYVKKGKADNTLVVGKGGVTGARLRDKFCLLESALDIGDSLRLELTDVRDFESDFKFLGSTSAPQGLNELLRAKPVVRLVERAPIYVQVRSNNSRRSKETMQRIRNEWESELLCLVFPGDRLESQSSAALHVRISGDDIEIRDDNQQPFDRLPKISATNRNMVKQLMLGLKRMHSFQSVYRMKTPEIFDRGENPFKFELVPVDPVNNPEVAGLVVASHRIKFTNTTTNTLWFAVLSFNSQYGIEMVHPKDGGGRCVPAGKCFDSRQENPGITDTVILPHLEEQYKIDGIIHDIIRVVVTTKPVDLKCFQQPDVTWHQGGRHGVQHEDNESNLRDQIWRTEIKEPTTGWWIEDHPITPKYGQRPKIKIPPSNFKVGQLVYDARLQNRSQPFVIADKPRPRDPVYLLCNQDGNPVNNVLDGGREFEEVYLRKA